MHYKLPPKILPSSNFYIFLRHVGVVLRKIEGKVELGSYLLYFLYLKTLKTSQNNSYMGNSFHVSLQNIDKRQKKTGRLVCYTSELNKVTTKGYFHIKWKKWIISSLYPCWPSIRQLGQTTSPFCTISMSYAHYTLHCRWLCDSVNWFCKFC